MNSEFQDEITHSKVAILFDFEDVKNSTQDPFVTLKVRYVAFENFGAHKILNIPRFIFDTVPNYTVAKELIRTIIWNAVKDEDWDWPITWHDIEITAVTHVK